jgi:hypothetical protein
MQFGHAEAINAACDLAGRQAGCLGEQLVGVLVEFRKPAAEDSAGPARRWAWKDSRQ